MVNDRFIKLLTKELSDRLTEPEREELQLLLQENKEYRDQKKILEDYWQRDRAHYSVNAAMFKKVLDKIEEEENIAGFAPRRKYLRIIWYSAAAVIMGIVGILTYRYFVIPKSSPVPIASQSTWLLKSTKPTIKSKISLSDGTVITLNSATTLKYPDRFNGLTREVYLDGEAYFDVAKDSLHPFIIHTNKMNIRVLGTSFNVKSYNNELLSETTLIRGSIEVTLNDRPSDRIILKPKEKLIVQNDNSLKKKTDQVTLPSLQDNAVKGTRYSLTNLTYFTNNAKTVVETSWVENKLVFSDKDFEQLSGQLERWYGVHIEFANDHVKEYRFTGLFEKETLPEALNALRLIEHFNYKIKGTTAYIY